jgi:hypothetical protein
MEAKLKMLGKVIVSLFIALVVGRLAFYSGKSATITVINESESASLVNSIFTISIQRLHNISIQSFLEHGAAWQPRYSETKVFKIKLLSADDSSNIVERLPSHKNNMFNFFINLDTKYNNAYSDRICDSPKCKSKVVGIYEDSILFLVTSKDKLELVTVDKISGDEICRFSGHELRQKILRNRGANQETKSINIDLNNFSLTKGKSFVYKYPLMLEKDQQTYFKVVGCNESISYFKFNNDEKLKGAIIQDANLMERGYVLVWLKSKKQRAIFNIHSNKLKLIDSNKYSNWVTDKIKTSILFYKLNDKNKMEILTYDLDSNSSVEIKVDVSFEFDSLNYRIREKLPVIF